MQNSETQKTTEINYTPSQQEAIFTRDKNILVSAGAGSGKTFVMTQRIVNLIKEGLANADELLVVTFTKAAASQMKSRIRSALIKQAKSSNDENLYRQVAKLESSQISTVHALCSNIIKQYYQTAQIDPSFGIISDADEDILLSEAIDETFDTLYEANDEDFFAFVNTYTNKADDAKLKESIKAIYKFTENRIDKINWLKNAYEDFNISTIEEFKDSIAVKKAIDFITHKIELSLELFESAYELCVQYDTEGKRLDKITTYSDNTKLLYKYIQEKDYSMFFKELQSISYSTYNFRKQIECADEIKALQNDAKSIIKELKGTFAFTFEEYYIRNTKIYNHMKSIFKIIEILDEIYQNKKAEQNSLTYSDLEHYCLRVLRNDEARKSIQNSYKFVFVDEYQDTNDIQEEIINLIKKENNLFTVGDVKQSIYSFREAEPTLFTTRRAMYENSPECGSMIHLSDNFRSDAKIINAVNTLFSRVMTKDSGGIDYKEANESMNSNNYGDDALKPEIHTLYMPKADSEYVDESNPLPDKKTIEAMYVAKTVKDLLNEQIFDKELNSMRKIIPSDIAILSRSMNSAAKYYIEACKNYGISTICDDKDDFYDLMEVSLVINLIKVIDNYKDDIALASVMRSIIYNFTPDELVSIKLHSSDEPQFYNAVTNYVKTGENEDIVSKIGYMLSQINEFTEFSRYSSLEDLVRRIYSKTNIYAQVGTLPDGEKRQNNLRVLKNMASGYESTSMKGLGGFINYLQKAKDSKLFKKSTSQNVKEGVRLMTIHKSKGLEFNIVFVVDCATTYRNGNSDSNFTMHKDLGICPVYKDDVFSYQANTLNRDLANALYKMSEAQEEMRILYVAATRAIKRLYFTALVSDNAYKNLPKENPVTKQAVIGANSFITLLYLGLYESDDAKFFEFSAQNALEEATDNTLPTESEEKISANDNTDEIIKKNLSYSYPYQTEQRIPTKMSVSELKNSENLVVGQKVIQITDAPSFAKDESITSADIGTMTHYLLQNIDINTARQDTLLSLNNAIEAALKSGIITKTAAELINKDSVMEFLNSPLGQKMINADVLHREYEFILRVKASEINEEWADSDETLLIQGVIDCLFEYENEVYILDYKTDRNPKGKRRIELNEIYSKQVKMYAKAYEMLNSKKADKAYICYLSVNETEEVTID